MEEFGEFASLDDPALPRDVEESENSSSLADPALIKTIDKLFECNIGEFVALPQLIVVGDQSSGKSSVLEGLTGLPFPRDSGLCTRFATQIVFQRAQTSSIEISIIPANNSSSSHKENLQKWKQTGVGSLNKEWFAKILVSVHEAMGLQGPTVSQEKRKTFSDDILKIEICGPDQEHLSVIDVPGIFKKKTEGLTTKEDISMVREMVMTFMKNPRSAILAVIPANVDIATQEILEMAEQCDTQGQRTLGVLTKPDLVDRGAEQRVIDLLQGKSHKLNLGWCIVRNPGQQELDEGSTDRNEKEIAFFSTRAPWTKIEKEKTGIKALRERLGEILADMVRREFPKVKAEINKRLKEAKLKLDGLGPCRETRQEQHGFLLHLATEFQAITSTALSARYGDDDIFVNCPNLRLATAIRKRNDEFSADLHKRGHTYNFKKGASESEKDPGEPPLDSSSLQIRYEADPTDLDDLLYDNKEISGPESQEILDWLETVYKSSRGFEMVTYDASLFSIIWKKQSEKWEDLALGYISDVVSLVHCFIVNLLEQLCVDDRVRPRILTVVTEKLVNGYQKAIGHANFILQVERGGTPQTMNHYYAENVEKYRQERIAQSMKDLTFHDEDNGPVVKLESLKSISQRSPKSNLESIIQDLHDSLKSYYKVAHKRFVDTVCMQAADYYLIKGPESPMKVLSPYFVSGLSTEQLEDIAGEEYQTKRKRTELKREINLLAKGKSVLI